MAEPPYSKTYRNTARGIELNIKVEPRSAKRGIAGIYGDALKVKLTSAPVEGRANEELVELLSDFLKVKKSDIRILRGGTSKRKVVEITGLRELKLP
ncbi:MAG: DUF167 domain-containing protein [Nitrospiraceae bacterium]|nr:DUF167 domain-containing protein [Nitrospiraceae bacterium]